MAICNENSKGAFHLTKILEISGQKSNGTGKDSENLGIRFECALLDAVGRVPGYSASENTDILNPSILLNGKRPK